MKKICDIDPAVLANVRKGCVIPAQPLALDADRKFSPVHQRALCRYYIDSGVGGIAVGVHSTQFEIRKKEIGLFEPVLAQTAGFIDEWSKRTGKKILKVAFFFVVKTDFFAANYSSCGNTELSKHCVELFGAYLVGQRKLGVKGSLWVVDRTYCQKNPL